MPRTLEKEYTWPELCDLVLARLKEKIPAKEHTQFRKWFMEREKIGFLFDYKMVLRCYNIWKELKNNLDHFIVISGREGLGKSTLAMQIASWIEPSFSTKDICYNAENFLEILRNRANESLTAPNDFKSIVMDEGTELLSREAQNLTNRILTKTFFIQRALKCLVIINIPNFHMIDPVIRYHRVKTLIQIIARAKYKAITGEGIRRISKKGKDTKEIETIRLQYGTFWEGDFRKPFPKTLSFEDYEMHKYNGIRKALDEMQGNLTQKKMIPASQVAKELGVGKNVMPKLITEGKAEGKKIGGRWYITKKSHDKLLGTGPVKPSGEQI